MSIDKQALRECFEKWWEINYHNGKPPRFGWECWRDGEGYQIDDDESELDGMWESWQAAHSEKLEAAESRIAELIHIISMHTVELGFGEKPITMAELIIAREGSGSDVLAAIRAAGISVKGE